MNKMNQNSENVKNPKLVAALQEMLKHDDFITRSQMAAALMEARLLSPIQKQTVLTEKKGPSTWIRFESITNTAGEKYYLAFTDMDEYSKWNEDVYKRQRWACGSLTVEMVSMTSPVLWRRAWKMPGLRYAPHGFGRSSVMQLTP